SAEELAEIDWIHVGGPAGEGPYAAPTRSDAIASATVAGVPRRGISLRAPGWARCSGMFPSGGWLEAQVALVGATDGGLEVRLARDRQAPKTLASYRLAAADAGAWKAIKVPLGDLGERGAMSALVVAVKSVSRGGRVFFGEPRILPPAAPGTPPARAA